MAQGTGSRSAAEGAAQAADGAARAAEGAAQAAAAAEPVVYETERPIVYEVRRPIVYEVARRGKRKGKKKYSRGLKDPQKLERDASRAAERLADAVADGISEYRDSRDRSARRKRDGAIKDVVRNAGRGLSEALDTGSRVPSDLTRRATAKRLSRMMRPVMPPPFSYFMRSR